ncbi:MAG: bglA [Aeromicrobium sp.]|nr:bglA [Aeromicrobium sp.]
MSIRLATATMTAACALALLTACSANGTASPRALVWADEFDGPKGAPPSSARWTYDTGGSGWGNYELQCYTTSPRNASTDGNGNLVITARREAATACAGAGGNAYTSARLTTREKFTFMYGRVEARIKMPSGVGTWPAFWALGADIETVGWPQAGELDVVEHLPREPRAASAAVHGPTASGGHWYVHRDTRGHPVLSEAFHVYAMEWTASRVDFFVDDVKFGTVTKAQAEERGLWKADHPYYLLLNLAVGGVLGGEVPASTVWPQHLTVDYVRVYE